MESLEVAELHMSGARAVFTPKRGKVKKGVIAAAFEEQGMKLESYTGVRRPRAKAIYNVDSGIT